MKRPPIALALAVLLPPLGCDPAAPPPPHVGPTPDHGTLIPTRQLLHPAGRSVELHGRPVDLALSPALPAPARAMEQLSETLNLDGPDQANEDHLNRILWFAARPSDPYPAAWAGAHDRGLKALGLRVGRRA